VRESGALRYHVVWGSVLAAARARGIGTEHLRRVRAYLRHRFGLDAADWAHPSQRPRGYFPGLTGTPVHDPKAFPWVLELEAAYAAVREEFDAVRAEALSAHPRNLVERGRWNVFELANNDGPVRGHLHNWPETRAVISRFPGAGKAGLVYFSIMEPGTHVRAHCGPANTRLRCHLALSPARGCRLRVDDQMLAWSPGRCLVFDDSFEHEVWHRGSLPRAVLIVDFWHPDLTENERWALGVVAAFKHTEFGWLWRKAGRMLSPGRGSAAPAPS